MPCGSRGLPIALTTYHRRHLIACFPPEATWPDALLTSSAPRRGERPLAAGARRCPFASQNQIEEQLITLVWHLLSPAVRGVLVADRGFARSSLFRWLLAHGRDFVIRIDPETHGYFQPDQPSRAVGEALALRPGERRWCPQVAYHQEDRVPLNLLGCWEPGQREPWYLVTSLDRADWTETAYRWRMRIEAANRDEKTGLLLRESGEAHRLRHLCHLHRLLLVLAAAEWFCALVGLQALADLPTTAALRPTTDRPASAPPAESGPPLTPGATRPGNPPPSQHTDPADPPEPSLPPPVLPHRDPRPKLPPWLRRFAAWGQLSYVRLGLEVIRAPDLGWILQRLVRWLDDHLSSWAPLWRPWQRRYRLKCRWGPSG